VHDADTIAALLDKIGAQISFSYDAGSVTFSARSLKKDSQQVIDLLAEQLMKPSFDKDEFEKLRKQKLAQARQMRDDTSTQASIAFRRAVFPAGHPQYRLTVEERLAALEKMTVADVSAFHAKSLGPDHSTLVIVGDVEPSAVQASVASAFADWKGGRALLAIPSAKMNQEPVELTSIVPGKQSVNVILGVSTGLRYVDADYLPLEVATNVLGRGFTSRLVGAVRDTEGLTYGIAAGLAGSGKLDHAWAVNATFAPSLLAQGLASTRRELAKWHRDGITADELEYRKSSLAGAHRVSMATSRGLASMILNTVRRGLELTWIDEYPNKVAALTLPQVNGVIKKYVDPEKLVTVRAGSLEE
jgi:zinc protease